MVLFIRESPAVADVYTKGFSSMGTRSLRTGGPTTFVLGDPQPLYWGTHNLCTRGPKFNPSVLGDPYPSVGTHLVHDGEPLLDNSWTIYITCCSCCNGSKQCIDLTLRHCAKYKWRSGDLSAIFYFMCAKHQLKQSSCLKSRHTSWTIRLTHL